VQDRVIGIFLMVRWMQQRLPCSLIRDVSEEECKFCEECEMGNFIKRQMNEWDKDGDRKLNAHEFLG
jgi:hypothetical protein